MFKKLAHQSFTDSAWCNGANGEGMERRLVHGSLTPMDPPLLCHFTNLWIQNCDTRCNNMGSHHLTWYTSNNNEKQVFWLWWLWWRFSVSGVFTLGGFTYVCNSHLLLVIHAIHSKTSLVDVVVYARIFLDKQFF